MLENLNLLALEAKKRSDDYNKNEFVFSDKFKLKFKELLPNYNITFYNYTSVVTTATNLLIIVPNQWFVIASFFNSYISALKIYKDKVNELGIDKDTIKEIRDNGNIDTETEAKITDEFQDADDTEKFKMFLTDYEWWFGSKTIDRGDYYVSSILNLASVINNSQSYIADLAYTFSEHPELVEIFEEDYSTSRELLSSGLSKPENIIYYGSPGTGKSYKVNEILKPLDSKFFERITFHPEYDNASFVGGYKPISEKNVAGIDEVKYKFVPQAFTKIYVAAWKDPNNQYYLAIEEINRGNCAEIFGDIFQLLDRNSNYTVTPSSELQQHLIEKLGLEHDGIKSDLKLPPNLSLLATMNTSDQSLFPMDSAFKRRWDWEYMPICYLEKTEDNKTNDSFKFYVKIDNNRSFGWIDFIKSVNNKIKHNDNLGMDKCIGNYFIKPEKNEISLKEFVNKAIFYLWNDVFKDEDKTDSIFGEGIYYEGFFPIESNGKELLLPILKSLDVEVIEIKPESETV
jgi:hypothetical protein